MILTENLSSKFTATLRGGLFILLKKEKIGDADHERLKNSLKEIKGKFILSYNNDDFVRELYQDFNLIEISRRNSLLERYDGKDKEYKEVIITNC